MQLTAEQSRILKQTGILLALGLFLGPAYVVFSDGFHAAFPFINGAIIGLLVASIFAFFEFSIFTGEIRKLPFYKMFLFRVALYTI